MGTPRRDSGPARRVSFQSEVNRASADREPWIQRCTRRASARHSPDRIANPVIQMPMTQRQPSMGNEPALIGGNQEAVTLKRLTGVATCQGHTNRTSTKAPSAIRQSGDRCRRRRLRTLSTSIPSTAAWAEPLIKSHPRLRTTSGLMSEHLRHA
jgi:hypothetical protein